MLSRRAVAGPLPATLAVPGAAAVPPSTAPPVVAPAVPAPAQAPGLARVVMLGPAMSLVVLKGGRLESGSGWSSCEHTGFHACRARLSPTASDPRPCGDIRGICATFQLVVIDGAATSRVAVSVTRWCDGCPQGVPDGYVGVLIHERGKGYFKMLRSSFKSVFYFYTRKYENRVKKSDGRFFSERGAFIIHSEN